MTREEWKERYIARIMKVSGYDRELAEETYVEGIDFHDYEDDPEDAADDEMSYWSD